jgi:hypothetical protein
MKPFELATMALFLSSYLFTALRAILTPDAYRSNEVKFYKQGTMVWDVLLPFVLGALAFPALLLHFVMEPARLGEILLYAQVMLFLVIMPMHFMPFMRNRMTRTLSGKSNADYRKSGLQKIAIAAVMIALPFLVTL